VISTIWRVVFFEREDLPCGAMDPAPPSSVSPKILESVGRHFGVSDRILYLVRGIAAEPRAFIGELELQALGGAFWRPDPTRAVRKNPADLPLRKCNEFNTCSSQKCRMP